MEHEKNQQNQKNKEYYQKRKNDPEFMEKLRENRKKRMNDPEFKKKQREYMKSYLAKKSNDPEFMEKKRKKHKKTLMRCLSIKTIGKSLSQDFPRV